RQGQDRQGAARRAEEVARVRRGAEHPEAPHSAAVVTRHPARRAGGGSDREGGPDPHLQRDGARPEVGRSHAGADRARGRPAQARREALGRGVRRVTTAEARIVPRLKERYEGEIRPALIERFSYTTPMQAPRLVKITLNMGVGDAKQDTNILQAA